MNTIYFTDRAIFEHELEMRSLPEQIVLFEGGETAGAYDRNTNELLVLDEFAYENAPNYLKAH